jgi:hypothetical protein
LTWFFDSPLICFVHYQAREFGNELRASTKVNRNLNPGGAWLEGQGAGGLDTSTVSDAYAKMLRIFIPLLVDEVSLV